MVPRRVATRPQCTAGAPSEVDTQWATFDDVCLHENARQRFAILQGCPVHPEGEGTGMHSPQLWKQCTQQSSNMTWRRRSMDGSSCAGHSVAGPVVWGKAELSQRFDLFFGGQWDELHQEAMRDWPSRSFTPGRRPPTPEKKARAALSEKCALVKFPEPRQLPHGLVSGSRDGRHFSGIAETQGRDLPREAIEHVPERPVVLDRKTFFDSLRSAPRVSSATRAGLHVRAFEIEVGCDRHTGTVVGNVQFARTRQSARRHWDCF